MASHIIKKRQQVHPILIQQNIHRKNKAGLFFYLCFVFSIFCCLMFMLFGCSVNNSAVEYLSAADARIDSAQKHGADQLAEAEFEEAKSLYAEGELALQKKDREALSIAQKALAKARLAEALARQAKAEADAAESEKARKKAQDNAERARKERTTAENELARMPGD